MRNCPKCGTLNDEGSFFCTHCGISLQSDVTSRIEHHAKQFADHMEQMGKKIENQILQATQKTNDTTQKKSRQFEERINRLGRRVESWSDRTFGIIGPLLESFIFLIVFRLAIMVMQSLNEQTSEIQALASILLVYILPLFLLTILSNYTGYFSRKFIQVKVFSPLLYAIFFVFFCWILSKILYDTATFFTISNLQAAASSLETNLSTIFIVVLLIGYVILIFNMPRNQQKTP